MASPSSPNNQTNTQLGRYKIVRELARSNDIVYEAIDPTMNRRVALKELNLPSNLTGQAKRDRMERFYREAKAAGTLNHRNIVTIYEISQDKDRHFIAMEYLDGQSLRDFIHVSGPLPLSHALQIGLDLCDALGYAHAQGVVHRDVKPDNVHLVPPGNTAKLTDFGIARVLEEPSLTSTGQVFGTPSYMSPEQLMARKVDHRTDLFSLGVMLFEIITGKKPFVGDSIVSITYAIMHSPVTFPAGMPAGITGILRRALAKDPEQRYPNAQSMAADLRSELMFQGSAYHKPTGQKPDVSGMPNAATVQQTAISPTAPDFATGDATVVAAVAPPTQTPEPGTVVLAANDAHAPPASTVQASAAPTQQALPVTVQPPPTYVILQPGQTVSSGQMPYVATPPPIQRSVATLVGTIVAIVALIAGTVAIAVVTIKHSRVASQKAVAVGYYNAGSIALDGGDAQKAIEQYKLAIKAAPPTDPLADSARRNMGLAYMALGDQVVANDANSAAAYYQQALTFDARNANAHYKLAQVTQDPYSSAKEYEKAISSDPNGRIGQQARKDGAALYLKLGTAAVDNHNAEQARSDLNHVIELAPADPMAEQARQRLTAAGL